MLVFFSEIIMSCKERDFYSFKARLTGWRPQGDNRKGANQAKSTFQARIEDSTRTGLASQTSDVLYKI
jgi:hypothetical protein